MATYAISVGGGSPFYFEEGTLEISETINGRNTLNANIRSLSGTTFEADVNDEVVITENSIRIFAGNIVSPTMVGIGGIGGANVYISFSAVDFNALADYNLATETFTAGTNIKTILTTLITNYLGVAGVTLDGAQVNGPGISVDYTIEEQKISDTLNFLSNNTDYIWEIDYNKVLRMYLPSSITAPYSFADGDAFCPVDFRVTKSQGKFYNRVVAKVGQNIAVIKHDEWTGDGSTLSFPLTYPIAKGVVGGWSHRGVVWFGGYATGDIEELDISATPRWTYNPSGGPYVPPAGTINRGAGAGHNPPALGLNISMEYDAQFPITISAEDAVSIAADGVKTALITLPDIYDRFLAQDYVDAYLAKSLLRKDSKTAEYQTRLLGFKVGQVQDLSIAERSLSGSHLIVGVRTVNDIGVSVNHTISVISGVTFLGYWKDNFKEVVTGGSSVSLSTGGGGASAHPPQYSVQAYNNGSLFSDDKVLINWNDDGLTGQVYGEEILTAKLAVGTVDEAQLQLALYNQAAGPSAAFSFWQLDDGTSYLEQVGTLSLSVDGRLLLSGGNGGITGGGIEFHPDNNFTDFITSFGLFRTQALQAGIIRVTGNHTLDSGGTPDFIIQHDSASNHTLTLTAVSGVTLNFSGTIYGRILIVKNGSAGGTFTIDPNASETIGGFTTLVLAADETAVFYDWAGTGAEWKLLFKNAASGGGSASAAGSDGDVQYSASSVLAAESNFNYNASENALRLTTDHTDYGGGTVLAVYGSPGDVTPSGLLTFLDYEPGTDAAVTMAVGVDAHAEYHYPVFTTAASGTHALLAQNYFDVGGITDGGAAVTLAATVYIAGDPGLGTSRAALYIAQGNIFCAGVVHTASQFLMSEISDPGNSPANTAWIFAKDNGSGKTQLMVRFPSGAAQQIAIEP